MHTGIQTVFFVQTRLTLLIFSTITLHTTSVKNMFRTLFHYNIVHFNVYSRYFNKKNTMFSRKIGYLLIPLHTGTYGSIVFSFGTHYSSFFVFKK